MGLSSDILETAQRGLVEHTAFAANYHSHVIRSQIDSQVRFLPPRERWETDHGGQIGPGAANVAGISSASSQTEFDGTSIRAHIWCMVFSRTRLRHFFHAGQLPARAGASSRSQ